MQYNAVSPEWHEGMDYPENHSDAHCILLEDNYPDGFSVATSDFEKARPLIERSYQEN